MKYRTKTWYFLICAAIVIAFLPLMNFDKFTEKYERKELFVTDRTEAYTNYAAYKFLNLSLEPDSVITGKDGFLFLGNKYGRVLHKSNGIYNPGFKAIDKWSNDLQKLQRWYEDQKIRFVMVIAPNKHSIYKEMLPNWVKGNGTLTDDIVSMSNEKGIHILDLRKKLTSARGNGLLYYKTDTHWNLLGASIGYAETIAYINKIYGTKIIKSEFKLKQSRRGGGDLSGFLKINHLLGKDYDLSYAHTVAPGSFCHGNINKDNGKMGGGCHKTNNPMIDINKQPQYVINNTSLNNYKVLLLRDSFGTVNSQLYNDTFHTIWNWHYGHINGESLASHVKNYKPDIVIYQVVERGIYNQALVRFPAENNSTKN